MSPEEQSDQPVEKPASLWRQTLDAQREEETGFGGVLLLFAIGRVLAPLLIGFALWKNIELFTRPQIWGALTRPESPAYHPFWLPVILFETAGGGLQLIASFVILWLFFGRKRALPLVVIAYLAFSAFYIWADYIFAGFIPAVRAARGVGAVTQLIFYTVISLVWITYFVLADRVKNTFVR